MDKPQQRDHRPRTVRRVYQLETLRPIVNLAFVVPFLMVYESGVILSGDSAARSGVDSWTHWLLLGFGAGSLLLLPCLTVLVLLARHRARRDRLVFRTSTLGGMAVESIGLGLIVVCAATAWHFWLHPGSPRFLLSIVAPDSDGTPPRIVWGQIVGFCGAGLYEELVFRMILFSGIATGLMRVRIPRGTATLSAAVVTSLLFAAAHHDFFNTSEVGLDGSSFAIRTLVSLFFCVVYVFRGFGIAVGTHVAYDVFAL